MTIIGSTTAWRYRAAASLWRPNTPAACCWLRPVHDGGGAAGTKTRRVLRARGAGSGIQRHAAVPRSTCWVCNDDAAAAAADDDDDDVCVTAEPTTTPSTSPAAGPNSIGYCDSSTNPPLQCHVCGPNQIMSSDKKACIGNTFVEVNRRNNEARAHMATLCMLYRAVFESDFDVRQK